MDILEKLRSPKEKDGLPYFFCTHSEGGTKCLQRRSAGHRFHLSCQRSSSAGSLRFQLWSEWNYSLSLGLLGHWWAFVHFWNTFHGCPWWSWSLSSTCLARWLRWRLHSELASMWSAEVQGKRVLYRLLVKLREWFVCTDCSWSAWRRGGGCSAWDTLVREDHQPHLHQMLCDFMLQRNEHIHLGGRGVVSPLASVHFPCHEVTSVKGASDLSVNGGSWRSLVGGSYYVEVSLWLWMRPTWSSGRSKGVGSKAASLPTKAQLCWELWSWNPHRVTAGRLVELFSRLQHALY